MFYIAFALFLFAASVIAHVFFCRKTTQSGLHAKAFGIISIIALGIYMTGVLMLPDPGQSFKITAAVIFILLVPIYLCFYVLTQLTSPSKKILLAIAEQGELTHDAILDSVEKEDFIMTRLTDLCISRCVMQNNGRYVLTSEGQKIAATLNVMQSILGRNTGG